MMAVKPRLLIVGAFPPPHRRVHGGVARSCEALLQSSLPERFDLLLVDSTQRSARAPNAIVRAFFALIRIVRVMWIVERSRPDAVLLFCSLGWSFVEKGLTGRYCRLRGRPTLLFLRGGGFMDHCRRSPAYRRLAAVLLRGAEVLPCQGTAWQQFFGETFGIPAERCPIVRNWTATPDLLALGAARAYTQPGEVRVLFLGWVGREKGFFELLAAIEKLAVSADVPRIALDVAGDGDAIHAIEAWKDRTRLADRVRILGPIDGAEKRDALRNADIFVLPSYVEGMPNAMIEAMAAGLPVVVTPVGAIRDVVRDGVHGAIVQVGDSAGLAAALLRLARDPELRGRQGRAAYEAARADFDTERAVDQLAAAIGRSMHGESHAAPTPPRRGADARGGAT